MNTATILKQHKLWVESGGTRGGLANLHRADLHGADLAGASLQAADLAGADLAGADLHGANLVGASLQKADLAGADLHGANLVGASLQKAILHRADLHGADLAGASLQAADLVGADLAGADLQRANLQRANLQRANLVGADLHGADLAGADLQGADLASLHIWQFGPVGSRGGWLVVKWGMCSPIASEPFADPNDDAPGELLKQAELPAPRLVDEVMTGCFRGTLAEFAAAVQKTHGDNQCGRQYRGIIVLVREWIRVAGAVVEDPCLEPEDWRPPVEARP